MLSLEFKSVRLAVLYVLLCGLCFAVSRWQLLAYCPDWRLSVVRELNEPADILFLGSSRTVRGIMPLEFEDELKRGGGGEPRSLNLGVFGTPRHINYLQLVDYLKRHDAPEIVFVEAGSPDTIPHGHQILTRFMSLADSIRVPVRRPYYARTRSDPVMRRIVEDMVSRAAESGVPIQQLAPHYPGGFLRSMDRTAFHLEMGIETLGRGPEDCVRTLYDVLANAYDSVRGSEEEKARAGAFPNIYRSSEPPINPATTAQQLADRGWYRIPTATPEAQKGVRDVQARAQAVSAEEAIARRSDVVLEPRLHGSPLLYTSLLSELCRERGIRLVFVLLPEFRTDLPSPSQVELYESAGEYFEADMDVLQQPENYQDTGHFNVRGAQLFSRMLARYLIENP